MPYSRNETLPPEVRNHLPKNAQDLYRAAFNEAFSDHAGDPEREKASHRIAWSAVKRWYKKSGETWIPRGMLD
jgi:cation transport regulator